MARDSQRACLLGITLVLACSRPDEARGVPAERSDASSSPRAWACLRPVASDIVYVGMDAMLRSCSAAADNVVVERAPPSLVAQLDASSSFVEPLPEQPEIMLLIADGFPSEAGIRRVVGLTRDCKYWIGPTHAARVTCEQQRLLVQLPSWRKMQTHGACTCAVG